MTYRFNLELIASEANRGDTIEVELKNITERDVLGLQKYLTEPEIPHYMVKKNIASILTSTSNLSDRGLVRFLDKGEMGIHYEVLLGDRELALILLHFQIAFQNQEVERFETKKGRGDKLDPSEVERYKEGKSKITILRSALTKVNPDNLLDDIREVMSNLDQKDKAIAKANKTLSGEALVYREDPPVLVEAVAVEEKPRKTRKRKSTQPVVTEE